MKWTDIVEFFSKYGDTIYRITLCLQIAILTGIVAGKNIVKKRNRYKLNI